MKLIVAFIRRSRRRSVELALSDAGVSGWSACEVVGHSVGEGGSAVDHLRIDVLVRDGDAEQLCQAVAAAGHTGVEGDGIAMVLPVETALRIDTKQPA